MGHLQPSISLRTTTRRAHTPSLLHITSFTRRRLLQQYVCLGQIILFWSNFLYLSSNFVQSKTKFALFFLGPSPRVVYNYPPRSRRYIPTTSDNMASSTAVNTLQPLLIDVRTPAEFSTGYLALSLHSSPASSRSSSPDGAPSATEALNIEYQNISSLPSLLQATHNLSIQKTHPITLYCRSGRRSNIALQTLRDMGYVNVRDIGAFEVAQEVLERESAEGRLWMGDLQVEEKNESPEVSVEEEAKRKQGRRQAFGSLMDGLKELNS